MKIYLSQINTIVCDLDGNVVKILQEFKKAQLAGADLALFCEMTITGYPAEDLWLKKSFLQNVNQKLQEILQATKGSKCSIILGAPHIVQNHLKNQSYNLEVYYEPAYLKICTCNLLKIH